MNTENVSIVNGFSSVLSENKKEMEKIDEFKNKPITTTTRNIIFGCTVTGTLLFFILFASQIITGVFALMFTVVFGVGALFGIRFLKMADPLIKQKIKNKILEEMVNEARKNASRQLDNQVIINRTRLEAARDARNKMGAAVKRLKSMINPENKGKPSYEKKMEMLVKVEEAYNQVKGMLERGAEANRQFEEKVTEYKDMERFASEVNSAMAYFKGSGGKQLEDILSLEAFTHIEEEFNYALVTIENQTSDMEFDAE